MIKQGHRYHDRSKSQDVLAMESGQGWLRAAPIDQKQPYPLGVEYLASADDLIPLGMAYFHGEVPNA